MQIRVLGPVTAIDGHRELGFPAAKERLLLATLVSADGRAVSTDRLIDVLWPDDPPRSARKTLQTYVLHLRRSLESLGTKLRHVAGGYALELGPGDLDERAWARLAAEGRLASLRGDHAEASAQLARALSLWRGDPYEDVPHLGPVAAEVVRLRELRLAVTEDLFDARLQLGDHAHLVAELEAQVAHHPHREGLWALLVRAHGAAGHRTEALRVFQRARSMLADTVGLEPGPQLRAAEAEVLAEPSVDHVGLRVDGPEAAFVTNADGLRIAYWTRGDDPRVVVLCTEWTFNLELIWHTPELRPLLESLSERRTLVAIQRRGSGPSDRDPAGFVPPERCTPDIDAVLDELSIPAASFIGWGHGGQVALAYAASRPERVTDIAIVNGYARLTATPEHPDGVPMEALEAFLSLMESMWGRPVPKHPILAPELAEDPAVIARFSRLERLVATPSEALSIQRTMSQFDVTPILSSVRAPVLVAHLEHSVTGVDNARRLQSLLPDAQFVQLPGYFIPTAGEGVALADAIREFQDRVSAVDPRVPPGSAPTTRGRARTSPRA